MKSRVGILVVDEDERICALLGRYLGREGYIIGRALSSEQMWSYLAAHDVDLVILDSQMICDGGLTQLSALRSKSDVAVIVLTGMAASTEKIMGLELGADDYITRPFDKRELLARVRTVLRRTRGLSPTFARPFRPSARFAGWTLDMVDRVLRTPEGDQVALSAGEFKLLLSLVICPNRVLTREEAMVLVSGRSWSPLDRSVDVMVAKLRRKIESNTRSPRFIKTIRGVGYTFTAHVEFDHSDPNAPQ